MCNKSACKMNLFNLCSYEYIMICNTIMDIMDKINSFFFVCLHCFFIFLLLKNKIEILFSLTVFLAFYQFQV